MRRRRFQSHTVDLLFTLSLFCVFAVCAFLVITMGVRVYRSTAQYLEDTYSARTALSYAAEKIRQHDAEGQVALTQLDGRNAILLTDEIEGSLYETYLYPDGEYICELVVRQGTEVSPSMGQQVLRADGFSIEDLGDGFLKLSAPDSKGKTYTFLLHLRNTGGFSGKE